MSAPIVNPDRFTGFLDGADLRRMYRVNWDLFPTADEPPAVSVEEARAFMRPTDWVVGVRIGEHARCYPAWMADNFHVINDILGGTPIAVVHCEICSSNAAWLAERNGERLRFCTAGLYGGTLSLGDMNTGSTWIHGQGVALEGPLRGTSLPPLESFQASFAEWVALYPETSVMTWTSPACHPDGRHGHGWEMTFGCEGMDPKAVETMQVGNDSRLPENEMVITLNTRIARAVLPLEELRRAGGVFRSQLGGQPLVTFSNGADSAMTGTFLSHAPDVGLLTFSRRGNTIVDGETRSTWRVDGLAVEGALAGTRLTPFPTVTSKWHSLACFLPDIEILRHDGSPAPVDPGLAAAILESLVEAGFDVRVERPIAALSLPDGALQGLRLTVDRDPFELTRFVDEAVAEDASPSHARRRQAWALASRPRRFEDACNSRPLPDDMIEWSRLLEDVRLEQAFVAGVARSPEPEPSPCPAVADLCAGLVAAGYAALPGAPCYRDALPARAASGRFVTIAGDPFIVYRFASADDAEASTDGAGHRLVAGSFVLRSDPDDLYELGATTWTLRRPDAEVSWSALLDDDAFGAALRNL